jgi:HK97 family phage major capsid protein
MKTNKTMKEIKGRIEEISKTAHEAYEQAGAELDFSKVTCLGEGDTKAKVEKLQQINVELGDLNDDMVEYQKLEKGKEVAGKAFTPTTEPQKKEATRKSFGERVMEAKAFDQKHVVTHLDIDVKTLFQRSAGWDPEVQDIPRVEMYPAQALSVMSFLPQSGTIMDTISYMKESTFTNNAAEVAEGGTYGEAALAYTRTTDEVEKVGVWLPVTDEQLEDKAGMAGILNNRLVYMLKARIEAQCLEGDGTTPNLLGTLSLASVQTQAKGAYPAPDAIHKAFTLIRATGFAEPNVVFINPTNWQPIRLLRTADGQYIFGSPQDPGADRIWGKPVLQTTFVTAATAIAGDYQMYSMFYTKRGIDVQVTNAHDDYFIKGKQAIRADIRCSMVHFRDTAFCKITGLST